MCYFYFFAYEIYIYNSSNYIFYTIFSPFISNSNSSKDIFPSLFVSYFSITSFHKFLPEPSSYIPIIWVTSLAVMNPFLSVSKQSKVLLSCCLDILSVFSICDIMNSLQFISPLLSRSNLFNKSNHCYCSSSLDLLF